MTSVAITRRTPAAPPGQPYICPVLPEQPIPAPSPQRPSRHRSRQAIATGIVAFVLGQLLLGWLLQDRLESCRDPAYGPKAERLRERLDAAPPNRPSLVVLGSSRVAWGVRGQAIEQAFPDAAPVTAYNFGLTGAGPVQQLLVLERLLKVGMHPDTLIVEVLPPLFAGAPQFDEMRRLPLEKKKKKKKNFAVQWGANPAAFDDAQRRSAVLPSYTNRISILQNTVPGLLPFECREDWYNAIDTWGATDLPVADTTAENRARARAVAHTHYRLYFGGFPLGGRAPQALNELLGRCRQEHIRVILLWMPEGPEFRSWYPPAVVTEVEMYLAAVQREYGVALVQARDWMPEEAFIDSHHLMPEAAAEFSRRLGKELRLALATSRGFDE